VLKRLVMIFQLKHTVNSVANVGMNLIPLMFINIGMKTKNNG